jgi:alpha-tubulin suppressor-like RCC1 family protein
MNGAVYCWGDNLYGQLGHKPGSSVDDVCIVGIPAPGAPCGMSPVQVQGLPTGVTAITAGTYHTCAIANGAAYCWGSNGFGELGDGTTTTTYQPVQVLGLTNVTAISAGAYPDPDGYDMTCAVANSDVYCWGSNAYGQLGNGTTVDSSTPVKVQFP